jgi:muramoyltetrapeptide carboxypeptidase
MIQPAYLKTGDSVAIIATARKISKEELRQAVTFLESYGLSVVFGKHLFEIDNQYAGTDAQRVEDLQWALNDPGIKAVLMARGGYGTVRLIESIDFSEFLKHPKWIVGYSDITVLHNAIHNKGVETLHATMPINFYKDEEATRSMIQALLGGMKYSTAAPHLLNRKGKASGELLGGNLSLIYALSGTGYDIDTTGKILFIEDLDEYLYHIDRMMMQLKLSGKLKNLTGLVVGGMTDMKDNVVPFGKTAEEIILAAVKDYDYPVCFHFPAGHIDKNMALYFGRNTTLNVQADSVSLAFD